MDRKLVLKSVSVMRPKSAMRAVPVLSTSMFACYTCQGGEEIGQEGLTYTLEIPMNDAEVMKVGYSGHDPRELDER